MKESNELQRSPKITQSTFPKVEQAQVRADQQASLKQRVVLIAVFLALAGWLGLCFYTDSLLISEALVSSSIIVCLLFLGTAGQDKAPS